MIVYDYRQQQTKGAIMKLNTVNVLHLTDGIPSKIVSYPDNEAGNKQAELSFRRAVDAITDTHLNELLDAESIDGYLDEGLYEWNGEAVYLIHS
jgi:hypothetical protein